MLKGTVHISVDIWCITGNMNRFLQGGNEADLLKGTVHILIYIWCITGNMNRFLQGEMKQTCLKGQCTYRLISGA